VQADREALGIARVGEQRPGNVVVRRIVGVHLLGPALVHHEGVGEVLIAVNLRGFEPPGGFGRPVEPGNPEN